MAEDLSAHIKSVPETAAEAAASTETGSPRAYLPAPKEAVPPSGPIIAAMALESAAAVTVCWLAINRLLTPVETALVLAVGTQLARNVNDRMFRPRPGPAPPGPHGFHLRFFRRGLTGVGIASFCYLLWEQFGPITVGVVGLIALSITMWLGYRLRRLLGARVRLRDASVLDATAMRLLLQATQVARQGELELANELAHRISEDPHFTAFPGAIHALALQRSEWAKAQGDLDAAETYLREAVDYHRSLKRPYRPTAGETITALGRLLVVRGRYQEAASYLKLATEVAGDSMYRQTKVQIEFDLAVIAVQTDDAVAARRHAQQTRSLAARWGAHAYHAQACDLLALLSAEDGDADTALALVGEAEAALDRDTPHPQAALVHTTRKALALQILGRDEAALAAYLQMMNALAGLHRGWGWRAAQHHLVGGFRDHELRALTLAMTLSRRGDPNAAQSFARLIEFAERTDLRDMLLTDLDLADQAGGADGELLRLLGEIADHEGTSDRQPHSVGRPGTTPVRGDDTRPYERLEALVSRGFRTIFETSAAAPPTAPQIAAAGTHVLQIRLFDRSDIDQHDDGSESDEVTIAGVWTSPDGTRKPYLNSARDPWRTMLRNLVGHVPIPDPTSLDGDIVPTRTRAPGSGLDWQRTYRYLHLITPGQRPWAELAALLLPPGLLEVLARTEPDGHVPRLLIVPDPSLWRLPWSALVVAEGTAAPYLIDHAVLTLLPSLSLLNPTPAAPVTPTACATYFRGVDGDGLDIERNALVSAYPDGVRDLSTPHDLIAALSTAQGAAQAMDVTTFLALSVHGNDRLGLAHSLLLDDHNTELSAARMLRLWFPPLLMINACMSAVLDTRRGTDPLGIPTVALCRGAQTIIGGVFPLPDGPSKKRPELGHSTAKITAGVYRALAEGQAPEHALRDAQRSWLADHPGAVPYLWAGLAAISAAMPASHLTTSE